MILEHTNGKDSVIEDECPAKENQSSIQNSQCGLSDQNQPMLPHKQSQSKYQCLNKFLYSIPWQIFITILTVFSLFSDDIRIVAFESSGDIAFDILSILMILIFLVEIILSWIAIEDYRFSFIFFLDLVSSLSIILDIVMLSDMIEQNSSFSVAKITSQSKLTRVATRIVRIVKLFRIIRVMKLYKSAIRARQIKEQLKKKKLQKQQNIRQKVIQINQQNMQMTKMGMIIGGQNNNLQVKKTENFAENSQQIPPASFRPKKTKNLQAIVEKQLLEKQKDVQNIDMSLDLHQIQQKQSKISKILSDMTIKKVIIVVLLLMFVVPLFDNDNYIDVPNTWDYVNSQLYNLLLDTNFSINQITGWTNMAISRHMTTIDNLVYFTTPFNQLPQYISDEFYQQRYQDKSIFTKSIDTSAIMTLRPDLTLRTDSTGQISCVLNIQQYNRYDSYLSIGRTMFICLVMVILLHLFSKNINELIVEPIEKMNHQVQMMAKNPQAISTQPLHDVQYETATVHNAIVKIGALLSLVFGSAGAQIIGQSIMQEGQMNVMIKGKKKCAIFGFCDIRNFTQITQILQQDIMIFVNTISQLVHSSVYRYGGAPNKNIGEAFLLVWNIPDKYYEINESTNQITWKNLRYINILADFSLLSFIKTIVKINKDPEVLQYRKGRLANHFGEDFKVQMGFGLHIGWAIEGAIGSQYKIDASYLSPNVNMASRLQAATRQFGVTLLISQDLYDTLTSQMKDYCRNIDRVTVKGSNKPLKLYTVDLNISNISPPRNKQEKYGCLQNMPDVQIKRMQNISFLTVNQQQYNAHQFVNRKKQLREVMVNVLPKQFKEKFENGLAQYYAGSWNEAKSNLKRALKIQKNDGPTKCILRYMKNLQYTAPEDWKNYRQLTSK